MHIALLYSLFAVLATGINIAAQIGSNYLYQGPWHIFVAMFIGTATGLVFKYILDKKYIFQFQARNLQHDGKVFFLYSAMGLVTTALFWGFELGFQYLFQDAAMRYLGAILGLGIGYLVKYALDKRFVFGHAL